MSQEKRRLPRKGVGHSTARKSQASPTRSTGKSKDAVGAGVGNLSVICLLRGVNLAGHNQVKMEVLRTLCGSLGFQGAQTYVQSGNVVFRCKTQNLGAVARKIEVAIEKEFGFHSDVVLRTGEEMSGVVKRNPFANRDGIEPAKLIVTFLEEHAGEEIQQAVRKIEGHPEEIHLDGREVYVYFPDGMGRSKLVPVLTRALKNKGTARNWNTVVKLVEMAGG